jgi:hypothetical protein
MADSNVQSWRELESDFTSQKAIEGEAALLEQRQGTDSPLFPSSPSLTPLIAPSVRSFIPSPQPNDVEATINKNWDGVYATRAQHTTHTQTRTYTHTQTHTHTHSHAHTHTHTYAHTHT